MTYDFGNYYKEFIGCLVFEDLLKCRVHIFPTRKGDTVITGIIAASAVEVKQGEDTTIITFISDASEVQPLKIHIGNDYWKYNDFKKLMAEYESRKLLRTRESGV